MKIKYYIPISLSPLIKQIAPYIAIAILLLIIVQLASANTIISQNESNSGLNISLYPGQSFEITNATVSITSINASLYVSSNGWANVYFTIAKNESRGAILWTSSIVNVTNTSSYWYNFDVAVGSTVSGEYYIQSHIDSSSGNLVAWRICTENCYSYGSSDFYGTDTVFQVFGTQLSANGINGVVYKTISGQQIAIPNAVVSLTNNYSTVTSTQVTDSTGYYQFIGLSPYTTYALNVKKPDEYDDSGLNFVTTGSETYIRKDIQLFPCTTAYNCGMYMQSVQFIVIDYWMTTRYPNVAVTVIKWDETISFASGITGADGSISFLLLKNQQYTLQFVNSSIGINITTTLVPTYSLYYIRTSIQSYNWHWGTGGYDENTVINTSVTTSILNSTYAYINVSYTDSINQTSNLIFYLNTSNSSDPLNQTILQSHSGGGSATHNYSFIVTGYTCIDYIVNVKSTHTQFGALKYNYGINFPGLCYPSGLDSTLTYYFGIALLIFIGGMAGATSSTQVGGVVVIMGWVLQGFGWISGVNTSAGLTAGLTLATIYIAISMMNDRAKNEGVA